MAEVINLADVRRQEFATAAGDTTTAVVEIFPSVSLVDLWRAWALSERAAQEAVGTMKIAWRRMG